MVRELDVNAIGVGAVFRGLDCHIVDIKNIATQYEDMSLWAVDEMNTSETALIA